MEKIILKSGQYGEIECRVLEDIFKTRKKVFCDRLNWDVSTVRGMEFDEYDTFGTHYLYVLCSGFVVGGVRLISTLSHYMVKGTFNKFSAPLPASHKVVEASRFHLDTHHIKRLGGDSSYSTKFLLLGMVEYALKDGRDEILTVVSPGMMKVLRNSGCEFFLVESFSDSCFMEINLIKIPVSDAGLQEIMSRI